MKPAHRCPGTSSPETNTTLNPWKDKAMTTLNAETTVGELVKIRPARARVFEQFKIDYCCGGKLPLAEACAKRDLDASAVLDQLQRADAEAEQRDNTLVDADAMGLSELADHIEQVHHAYLREELPRLDQMTDRVYRVHGEHEPRLADVRSAFVALKTELTSHMMKEEQILFPMIRQLETATSVPDSHCGSITNPIRQMESEHDNAGDALEIMNKSTDGYQPPQWACNTYRAMLDGLETLEKDMHQHIHKENNVLFPKAAKLEAELLAKGRA
jgi:regulator of cell morphogenesis and NO signaling